MLPGSLLTYADLHNQTYSLAQSEVEHQRKYRQPLWLDMENMRVLREKNTEIEHLQQQVQQLQVSYIVATSQLCS